MTGIEIFLLLIGCIFMIGSFFLSEKLSASELDKVAELSENELRNIINREIENAKKKMDDVIQVKMTETAELTEHAMEKESYEQMVQIHDYSESVMESMKKTHDEIMFLYSMLNDKHTEMTSMVGDLQRLAASIRNLKNTMTQSDAEKESKTITRTENRRTAPRSEASFQRTEPAYQRTDSAYQRTDAAYQKAERSYMSPNAAEIAEIQKKKEKLSNEMILRLYEQGMSKVDIAKKLGRGLGEVKLVLELYKGEEDL